MLFLDVCVSNCLKPTVDDKLKSCQDHPQVDDTDETMVVTGDSARDFAVHHHASSSKGVQGSSSTSSFNPAINGPSCNS